MPSASTVSSPPLYSGFLSFVKFMSIKIHKIIRSRRRSVALEITPNAQLVVRMPRYASVAEAKKFIWEKRDWIEKKLQEAGERIKKHAPKKFVAGEEFYYLGDKYKLNTISCRDEKFCVSTIQFNNGFYLSKKSLAKARKLFINWYKKQAKINIPKRVEWHANLHKLKYNQIKITSATRRWGSCTSRSNLNFTWRLILLPLKIVDYVVAHELAHLVHHNHSKKFWAQVEKMLPDYKERRKWLKKNGEEYGI